MRKQILILVIVIARTTLFAQNNERPLNSIQINLLGDASIISINYDKQFLISSTFVLSGKLGLGYNQEFELCFTGSCPSPKNFTTIPHHITGNIGKGRHFFEFGIGGTVIVGNTKQIYFLYPMVGYRILPLNAGKLNFRIFGQIPFSGLGADDILFVPFGLSLGRSF